ncbi:MAG: pyruvate ferredoxin oxidoreductase [Gammaproteobacteria bacterium]|nr:pyruvate ferredoxin oxidoreductase [Gammaproteobacteria bacterium]
MPNFANSALRLFQRLTGTSQRSTPSHAGVETVLDGNTAVAVTEACISETAGLGGTFPADAAALAWKAEQKRGETNCFGGELSSREAEGPRGALAAAIGLSMAGTRATAFLSGPDLMSAQDLLVMAAGRHLPLVAHMDNRTLSTQAGALGSGHKAHHISADSGCFLLFAANVQEAVDFTLAARRVAEISLIPGVVSIDSEQTALAVQDVRLPDTELVKKYLGAPRDFIEAPTPAQKLLFGATRRRVPCWHDLDRPVQHGALQGPESWALGAVANHPYFNQHLGEVIQESFALLSEQTGRHVGTISAHRMDNADIVLVAQGAAIETAEAVADFMQGSQNIGVLGIRSLRPFPGAEIARYLKNKRAVGVLERVDMSLASNPPLMRLLRVVMSRAAENARFGEDTHTDYPPMTEQEQPRLRSVTYGIGGMPLRAADLVALCKELEDKGRSRIYLGFDFSRASSVYPKRQVLLDTLRRDYPEIADLGLKTEDSPPDLRPADALTVAVHRISSQGGQGLAVEAAALLQRLQGGQVRSHPGLFWERWESYCVDRFTGAAAPLRDPGAEMPADISIIAVSRCHQQMKPVTDLRRGGTLLVMGAEGGRAFWDALPSGLQTEIRDKEITFYCAAAGDDPGLRNESQLGALFGILAKTRLNDIKPQRILNTREELLHNLADSDREARMNVFTNGFEGVQQLDYAGLKKSGAKKTMWNDEAPMAVRHLKRGDETYDSLPRFWDHVGVLYRNGEAAELSPDPYLATGVVPPLTSTFRDLSDSREVLPVFNPQECTGCGKCLSSCPDSALGGVTITAVALLNAGIGLAGADALRRDAKKLAGRMTSMGKNKELTHTATGEFIEDAYTWLKGKVSLDAERKQAMDQAVAAVNAKIGILPLARTQAFFHGPERQNRDSGAFLALAVNPDACKGCRLCIASCEPGALTSFPQHSELLDKARQCWKIWEELPDTPGDTMQAAAKDPDIGPMAGLLLSRHCMQAMAGGDGAEAGSGEKLAVRLTLAATEFQQQPVLAEFLGDIKETQEKLAGQIQKTFTEALPLDDLDKLSSALDGVKSDEAALAEMNLQDDSSGQGRVDAGRLRRVVNTTKRLGDLYWRVSEGNHGLGRARIGLAVAPGSVTAWAGSYPNNPFQSPVAVDMTGDTAQLAAGLLEGQLRKACDDFLLLRNAKLELSDPKQAAREAVQSQFLNWRDLAREERRLCPPMLLAGNDELLAGKGLAALTWLLSGELPIKIMVFANLDMGLEGKGLSDTPVFAVKDSKANLALLALAQRNAYVAQTAISHPSHFLDSVKAAFSYAGPALIHVHTPSPERHGFPTDKTLIQARLAVESRTFPLFRYDPNGEGVFGSRLDLSGNPAPLETWAENKLTPGDWAKREQRFATRFTLLQGSDPLPVSLAEYLLLDANARKGKTPFVTVKKQNGSEEKPVRCRVDTALAEACGERLHAWRTLQELAGTVTPFTARVKQEAEQRLGEAHQAEIVALKQEHEARLQELQAGMEADVAARIKGRLLTLAGYQQQAS